MKNFHIPKYCMVLWCLALTVQLQAFSFGGHQQDFQEVFQGAYGLNDVYKRVSSGMDSKVFKTGYLSGKTESGFVKVFQEKFGSLPKGNHRLIGHWGFEGAIPFNKEPYKTMLKQYPKAEVVKAWQSFVNKTVDITVKCTGLPRKQAKGLAGLIYDIHLLGDHSTTYTAPLPSPKYIAKDINKNLNRLFGNNNALTKKVQAEINAIPKNLSHKRYANRVKQVLNNNNIGEQIYNKYADVLEKNGISLNKSTSAGNNSKVVQSSNLVNRSKGLNIAQNAKALLWSAAPIAVFTIVQDAIKGELSWQTTGKISLEVGGGFALEYLTNKGTEAVTKWLAKKTLQEAGKKATKKAVAKLAAQYAANFGSVAGFGVPLVFSAWSIGSSIHNYNQGNINQNQMLVNIGGTTIATAGGVLLAAIASGAKLGALGGPWGIALGIGLGFIGGAAGEVYNHFATQARLEREQIITEEMANREAEDILQRLDRKIQYLRKESKKLRQEAWQKLLPQTAQ